MDMHIHSLGWMFDLTCTEQVHSYLSLLSMTKSQAVEIGYNIYLRLLPHNKGYQQVYKDKQKLQ